LVCKLFQPPSSRATGRQDPRSWSAIALSSRALTRYVDDSCIEIDISAAERALRAVTLGRKNYLFCGSDGGGESAAAIYTLLGTARLNGLDPERRLLEVLRRIADHPLSRIEELLPWIVAAEIQPIAELAYSHL
jgi:transposase